MDYFKLPLGVQDLLPDECYNFNLIKGKLSEVFEGAGCKCVSTAIVDYYGTYSDIANRIPQEDMFKLVDGDGKLLVLRPDMTLSLARMAAKLKSKRTKLCYFSNIWKAQSRGGISAREVFQAGVEFFGSEGPFADAEVIALAIESLLSLGLAPFIIDIGHVGYFKGILAQSDLTPDRAEAVRRYVNAKDIIGAQQIAGESASEAILALPTLFGGVEVLDRAEKLTSCKEALDAVAYLRKVYELLVGFGYEKYISIDLGMVKSLSYYSGVVFSGMVSSVGSPILSGGRYDNLAKDFDSDFPAVGFAIGLKRVLVALERQGGLVEAPGAQIVVVAYPGYETQAYEVYRSLRKEGKRVDLFSGSVEEGVAYAKRSHRPCRVIGKEEV